MSCSVMDAITYCTKGEITKKGTNEKLCIVSFNTVFEPSSLKPADLQNGGSKS